jgi:hypothetical protein
MAHYLTIRGFSRRGFRVDQDSRINYSTSATVDLDDQKQMRILKGHRNDFFTSPEFTVPLRKAGVATTGAIGQYVVPRDMKLKSVVATVGAAPTDDDFIVDVHRVAAGGLTTAAGTTVFTDPDDRPTIADGETVSDIAVPAVTAMSAGDILRVEIDQIGSTDAGSNLYVYLTFGLV